MNAEEKYATRAAEREAKWMAEAAASSDEQAPVEGDIDFSDEADDGEPVVEAVAETDADTPAPSEADDDPHRLGRHYLDQYGRTEAGEPTIAFYRGEVYRWNNSLNSFEPVAEAEIRGEITKSAKAQLDVSAAIRLRLHLASGSDDKPPMTKKVTRSLVANVMNVVESMTGLPSRKNAPFWLNDDEQPFDPNEILVAQNGLVHLPSLVTGLPSLLPPTPLFFTTNSLGCSFDPAATCPMWMAFLESVWPDDKDSIDLLAEWIGYLLLHGVSHHKILLIVGPMRSGKGTIGRILKLLLGQNSVANPTLGSLAGPFGLWPLLGKSAAVISDARLSNKVDATAILERLLSISGGDPQNIDRKCLPSLTAVMMPVRFTVLSNELPKLTDASGAVASRFVVLKMTRTFLGKEDKGLDSKLAGELSGILNWAIRGWQRLRERGRFSQPESGGELLQELRDLTSPVGMFVRQTCITGPEWSVGVTDIYLAWCEWCRVHGRDKPGTEQSFGRDLRAAVSAISVRQQRVMGGVVRRYEGIAFNPSVTHCHAIHPIGREVEKEILEWHT